MMRIHGSGGHDERVLTVTGVVRGADAHQLQSTLVGELGHGGGHDVVVDVRKVTAFDDDALPALTAGRSRAKFLHRRIALVDGADGATTRALRRSGHIFRFPVHADAAAARTALAAERSELAARNATRSAGVPVEQRREDVAAGHLA